MNLDLLPHQHDFCTDNTTRYLGLVSGFGAGKTYAFCVKAILLAAQNTGCRGVLMEPTFGMVKRTLIPEFERTLELMQVPYEFKVSDSKFILKFAEGETEIMLLSGENWRRMAGLNLAFFGVDELDTINKDIARDMWQMAMSRLRQGKVYQGFTTSTPEGFKFMYDFFKDNAEGKLDRRLIHGKTSDNPYLPPEFIQSLLDNYPPNLIKAYLDGEFTNLTSGTVYYAFDRKLNSHDKYLTDFPDSILHIGLDFNVGKMAAIAHVVEKQVPYAVDEIMGARNTEQMIEIIKAKYPKRHIIIYPDASGRNEKTSAGASDISMLKASGFELSYPTKNPFVRDRVNSMNAMFCNAAGIRRYFINTKTCPTYTKALEQQVYNKAGEPDKLHDQDHPTDAGGYFIFRNWPLQGKASIRSY